MDNKNQGINPFVINQATTSYSVDTTYVPHTDVTVPAVQPVPVAPGAPTGAWHAPPQPSGAPMHEQPGHQQLQFTNTTTVPSVSGNIAKPGANPPQQPPHHQQQQQQASDTRPLLRPDNAAAHEEASKFAFYNLRRYRPYFDVDTREVLWRVGSSFIGPFSKNFMEKTQESPDLYGPFWIATTLIFVTAVSGNYANYIDWVKELRNSSSSSSPSPASSNGTDTGVSPSSSSTAMVDQQWFTDYTKISASAGIFYGYIFIVGLLLWLVLRYFRGDMKLANIFCIYGYALTIYIPISLVCIIPSELLRWLAVMSSTAVSALFLLRNVKEQIFAAAPAKAVMMLLVIVLVHFGLGLALKLYFFQY